MSLASSRLERPHKGGAPARRAMIRWAWRLLEREWRQQLLILLLIIVAVAATTVGVGVASNTPLSSYVGFGTANDLATFSQASPAELAKIASWREKFGTVEVIENEIVTVPGTIDTFDLRAQNPSGTFTTSLLAIVSGRYPRTSREVAVTSAVASDFHLHVGSTWRIKGVVRTVVGIVENPEDLLDQFALVLPGQVPSPTQITVLFDAPRTSLKSLGKNVITPQSVASSNFLNPETITIALATVTMLLIALVAIAGFTVLSQRRLRSMGVLASLGATDEDLALVVRANGLFVGIAGAIIGFVIGLGAWLAYRPILETSAHHVVGIFELPWAVVGASMVLAVAASYFASTRPARAMARLSIVSALAGRPAPPRRLHRTAMPGVTLAIVSFFVLGYAGSAGGNGGGSLELIVGFVALIVSVVLLAPFLLVWLSRLARRGPLALRMALRDLARYRARSGSALGAISIGIFIAIVVIVASASRFSNVLDYAGPNVSSTQVIIYTPNGPYGPGGPGDAAAAGGVTYVASMSDIAHGIARSLNSRNVVELESTSATLQHAAPGRSYSGPLYVATPQLLKAYGIKASSLNPKADVLTMRPGFASLGSMQIVYGNYFGNGKVPGPGNASGWPCPKSDCLANPVIEQVSALPAGTSAPNTVITEHAVHDLGLTTQVSGWLIQTAQPLSALQISDARATAAAAGMSIETKSSIPTSATIINWATLVGILLALGVLALTIGLIRTETASDLRILTATGASSFTRRDITAATAGTLAFVGAVVGTAAGYLALVAFSRSNSLDGLSSLSSVPVENLLLILLAMPAVAAAVGWTFAGKEPPVIAKRPLE